MQGDTSSAHMPSHHIYAMSSPIYRIIKIKIFTYYAMPCNHPYANIDANMEKNAICASHATFRCRKLIKIGQKDNIKTQVKLQGSH